MRILKPHPAALAFPLMKQAAFDELKKSILERGQDFPAVVLDGKILDGRNRQEAVRQLVAEKKLPPNTELKTVPFRGGSIAGFVRAANVERRHLSESQLAMIASRLLPLFRKEAKDKQRAAAKATNRSKKAGQKALTLVAPGHKAKRASERAAEASGGKVSARSVDRAEFIRKNDPALAKRVENDELTLKQAEKKIRRRAQDKVVEKYVPPEGKFNVVTVDFSWEYDDKLDGSDAVRGGPPYPPMKIEQIVEFIRGPLTRCCDDVCVLGSWITGPMSLDLRVAPVVQREIEALGFKVLHERVWKKTRSTGGQFVGLGRPIRWDAEKLQLYVRGPVLFNELGEEHGRPIQQTVFEAPVGEHSEKPQKAYDDLAQLVPYTSRLEMFARAEREGWVTSGAELQVQPPGQAGHTSAVDASARGGTVAVVTAPEDVETPASPHKVSAGTAESSALAAEAVTSFSLSAVTGTSDLMTDAAEGIVNGLPVLLGESERSDLPAELECANCHETFVSREVLSKHAKACGEPLSVVDAIATGAAVIEISKDREAVLLEVKRLSASRPLEGSAADQKLKGLEKALEDFRARKRQTKADRAELAQRYDFAREAIGANNASDADLDAVVVAGAAGDLPPPVAPASVTAPPDDEIWF